MNLSDLEQKELNKRLSGDGLLLEVGAFNVSVASSLTVVSEGLQLLYGDCPIVNESQFIDFHVELKAPSLLRRRIRPQVSFYFDGHSPFKPLPQNQAFAMFEWGLNWCIANSAHQYLNIHAATLERNGKAVILPGSPGSGKSTLCAAMVHQGWRLLSDEMALVDLQGGSVVPIPRPVGLKNQSIAIIESLSSDLVLSQPVADTAKGTVAHMRPPENSITAKWQLATPRLVIFPKYRQGVKTALNAVSKGQALLRVAENSFNYNVLGLQGFRALTDLIDQSDCYDLVYEDMVKAMEIIGRLLDELPRTE